jgi:hypothetical protein
MRTLTGADVLRIWEEGRSQHLLDRLLTMLQAGLPGRSRQELADLTIGQRDRQLLDFRETHFGRLLKAYGVCPACQEPLEFALSTGDLRQGEAQELPRQEFTLADRDVELKYRLPTSRDLAAAAALADLRAAEELVLTRCLLAATYHGVPVGSEELPPETISQLLDEMARQDPQADVSLAVQCPACRHTWELIFDIGLFVWNDLVMRATRLVREVHILASAYGWSEAEILTLTPARRQAYLDLVLA